MTSDDDEIFSYSYAYDGDYGRADYEQQVAEGMNDVVYIPAGEAFHDAPHEWSEQKDDVPRP